MRLQTLKTRRKTEPLIVGAPYGQWEVIGLVLPLVEVRCKCGKEQFLNVQVLRHGQSTQCRDCRQAARRGKITHLSNLSERQIWAVIQSLSQLQMAYAAQLIRTRKFRGNETLSRRDLIEAVEMARLLTPAQIEIELRDLRPRYHAETRQSYQQYHSPKGAQL